MSPRRKGSAPNWVIPSILVNGRNIFLFFCPEFIYETPCTPKNPFARSYSSPRIHADECTLSMYSMCANNLVCVIADLPDTRPRISGSRPVYEVHQMVTLTCTSPGSKPAATLTFYINGEKVSIYLERCHPWFMRGDSTSGGCSWLRFGW